MKNIRIFSTLICTFVLSLNCIAQSGQKDYKAIATTLNFYLEGGTNNDFDTLKKAFHENATMKFVGDDGYVEVNALEFFKKGIKPGPKQNRTTRICQINISGRAANAQLEINAPTAKLIDYMNLLKIDGEWKIVNKIFYGVAVND